MAAPSMNTIADRFSGQGICPIFLYTHIAHPGEYYPHFPSMEQKFDHARDLHDRLYVTRLILLDSPNGACHRAYYSMPNMSWIFSKTGIPIYKSAWTDAHSLEIAIEYFLGWYSGAVVESSWQDFKLKGRITHSRPSWLQWRS
jgi:hypothetical protein